jgi:hypothetical protein
MNRGCSILCNLHPNFFKGMRHFAIKSLVNEAHKLVFGGFEFRVKDG